MYEQLYPFSKNRYFKKKRMRAVDFQRDQTFADGKLSFLSRWVFGAGVAFGLGVQRIDSDSLLVEPGMAVDAQGRFLIVDEPTICRVRALEGYDALRGETALLWLSYREELLDPMFVSDEEGTGTQYAVAKERFALSLGEAGVPDLSAADGALLSQHVLFQDEELRVIQRVPRVLSARQPAQLRLYLQCLSPEPLELELRYAPSLPGFSGRGGGPAALQTHTRVEKGERMCALTVWPVQPAQTVRLTVAQEGFSLEKRGVRHGLAHSVQEELPVERGDAKAALAARLRARSTQELWDDQPLGVPIAGVRFVRYGDKALLDDVLPLGPHTQAFVPSLQDRLERAAAYFPSDPGPAEQAAAGKESGQSARESGEEAPPPPKRTATGTVRLDAGRHRTAGSVLTSDELAHGLGPGTVYVDFGVEQVYPVANSSLNRTDLLLGDVSLFEQVGGCFDQDLDRGVRVHPDKGTFELAVRLRADLRQSGICLRWFAWRAGGEAPRAAPGGSLIRLSPDVIHVRPGARVSFTPIFSGGAPLPCEFFAAGRRDGTITRDGVYLAPQQAGLYQICAQVRDRPEERASAFILVEEEQEDGHGPDGV